MCATIGIHPHTDTHTNSPPPIHLPFLDASCIPAPAGEIHPFTLGAAMVFARATFWLFGQGRCGTLISRHKLILLLSAAHE